jgi:tetratricopeptide (TPR) repeat protein
MTKAKSGLPAAALLMAAWFLASTRSAAAQVGAMGMNMPTGEMHRVPPPDQLPAPKRMTGIGNSHIEIHTGPETQAWFDQGLSLLHDFWDYESAKAFEQAVRTDPHCAMCYWGLYQAEGMRGGAQKTWGDQALAQAVKLEKYASRINRLYIDAAEADSRDGDASRAQATALYRQLVKKRPHDVEARIFLAESLDGGFDSNGDPRPGQKEKIAILESVLKDAPNDSAANHYWIHAIEPGNRPEMAIASAARLASLAPTSGHMVHMPGHIYYRVGDYASADRWFAASTATDERYLREQHVSPDDDWNYVHNLMYAIASLMEEGRLQQADALSDHLAAARGELSATLYIWSARDQMARISRRLPVALRVADWSAVLTMVDDANLPDTGQTKNLRFLRDELRSFATGMQALDRGDRAAAEKASEQMDAGLWRQSEGSKDALLQSAVDQANATGKAQDKADAAKTKPGSPAQASAAEPVNPDAQAAPLVKTFSIQSLELRAGVLLLEGKLEDAKKLYADAAQREKDLGYREPPFYIRPVAETEADALLRAKDYAGAKAAYQAALRERPHSGFELYGIARADELAGNSAEAQQEYRAFLQAWPSADRQLPQLEHARAALGGSAAVTAGAR